MHMMRSTEQGAVKATEHKLYRMVGMMPNSYTTAYEFWQCLVANLLLTRGGYAKIERDRNGYVTALWNIPTRYVSYEGTNARTGEPYIQVTDDDGAMETLYPGEFLRVMGFRFSESDEAEDPFAAGGGRAGHDARPQPVRLDGVPGRASTPAGFWKRLDS